jgi:hypothetical protein
VSSSGLVTVDLDAAITAAELTYNSDFQIKFQQYDNYPTKSDGREWDDIVVAIVEHTRHFVTRTS